MQVFVYPVKSKQGQSHNYGLSRGVIRTKRKEMRQNRFPPGWDEERVRRALAHYEQQTEEEAVAEDEAAFEDSTRA
jgi:hypothetical protein